MKRMHEVYSIVLALVVSGIMGTILYFSSRPYSVTTLPSRATESASCDFTITIANPPTVPSATPQPQATPSPLPIPTPTSPAVQVCTKVADVALVLDRSGSMAQKESDGQTKLDWAKKSAKSFVEAIQSTQSTTMKISVVSFGGQGNDGTGTLSSAANTILHIDSSTDYTAIITAIDQIQPAVVAGTCIQCGIRVGTQAVSGGAASRVVILLSDGLANRIWDGTHINAIQITLDEAATARSHGVEFFVMGYGVGSNNTINESTLRSIAGIPGNYTYKPDVTTWNSTFLGFIPAICTNQ